MRSSLVLPVVILGVSLLVESSTLASRLQLIEHKNLKESKLTQGRSGVNATFLTVDEDPTKYVKVAPAGQRDLLDSSILRFIMHRSIKRVSRSSRDIIGRHEASILGRVAIGHSQTFVGP